MSALWYAHPITSDAPLINVQDYSGNTILDVLVLPTDDVIDYLTEGTGFLPSHFVPSGDAIYLQQFRA